MVMWVTQKKKIIHAQDLIVSIQIFYLCNNIMVTPKKKVIRAQDLIVSIQIFYQIT
jgi:hypothetical protein